MGLMMLRKEQRRQRRLFDPGKRCQLFAQQGFQEQLFFQPDRQGSDKRPPTTWRKRQVRLQEPLELHERFVIKDHVAEICERTVGLLEAVAYGMAREARILFFACKPLFLYCRQDHPIAYQTRGVIMIKSRDT